MNKIHKRIVCLFIICILLGAGTAYGHVYTRTLTPGTTATYNGSHNHTLFDGTYFSFGTYHNIYLSSNKTTAQVYWTRYYGSSSSDRDLVYGPYYIYDEYANNNVYYGGFVNYYIFGGEVQRTTSWNYSGFNATNDRLCTLQYVWRSEWGGFSTVTLEDNIFFAY